jgi:YD repeat-containing protein
VASKSPDAGLAEFWYDRLGRLAISRNAKQKANSVTENNQLYSYTKYDGIGRITEVGQVSNTTANGAITDAIAKSETSLNTWFSALNTKRAQITSTVYDLAYTGFTGISTALVVSQANVRNRVSYTTFTDTASNSTYNQGTFYTYDILGNVDTLLQDYGSSTVTAVANVMNANGNRFKKIIYQYDLISGKVNKVLYQHDWSDRFYHRYTYDAENRLVLAETSLDNMVWEKDAAYEYYKHGPLARVTLGDQQVQGLDYAYTLQGWLKGINSTGDTSLHDMGGDGKSGSLNQYTAVDAIGLTLNYFTGDYAAISGNIPFPGYSGVLGTAYRPLYNGNISSQSVYQRKFKNTPEGSILFYNYRYDQLNRLTGQDAYNGFSNNSWTLNSMGEKLKERIAYDANGNIMKYLRKQISGTSADMDSLHYRYHAGTNQLRQIRDSVSAASFQHATLADIEHQVDTSNYVYDAIGNLITDKAEMITGIKWNVYGKIQEISRTATAAVPTTNIKYTYDALGNRISQVVTNSNGTKYYTWYVRDAQGNILNTYTTEGTSATLSNLVVQNSDRYMYGSSRLGSYSMPESVDNGPANVAGFFYLGRVFDRGTGSMS